LLANLLLVGSFSFREIRTLAAQALHKLTSVATEYMSQTGNNQDHESPPRFYPLSSQTIALLIFEPLVQNQYVARLCF